MEEPSIRGVQAGTRCWDETSIWHWARISLTKSGGDLRGKLRPLWSKKLLGDYNPKVLVRTILVLNGKNVALRSAKEHLRFAPAQLVLHEPEGELACLQYTEDVSKTRQIRHFI